MILSSQSIKRIKPVFPFVPNKAIKNGMSYGLSGNSYDVRVDRDMKYPPGHFELAVTLEHFNMPNNLCGLILNKSTWARQWLLNFTTVVDAGFIGYLTLEMKNVGDQYLELEAGDPICQILFVWVDEDTDQPYEGKYQFQPNEPVAAKREKGHY